MTNIIELAKESGFDVDEGLFPFEATEDKFIGTERVLERFAALVAEATKEKVLACYSPDDTAQDWADKIKEIK